MTEKVIWYKRIWTRDASDITGGPMSSMHGHIRVDGDFVKGELIFRDCDSQISYEHWAGNKPNNVKKALKSLYKIRDMLDMYISKFEQVCKDRELT